MRVRQQGMRQRKWLALLAALTLTATVVAAAPATAADSSEPGDGASSAISSLMFDVAEGAAGQLGSSLVGWVLGSSGSADQELAVMNEILDELDTIENTLVDIENELAVLVAAIDQLDCDTWVQDAEPSADAISNLWNPNSIAAGDDPPPPQQSYVGIVSEATNNTLTVADMQLWVDQVLNNDGNGIDGKSVLDHLQDLGNTLIPPAGGSGVIKSCLDVPTNAPSTFKNDTDDVYYNTVVAPLINYYYAIQAQGVTMVTEALHFEAWQASGSPISTEQNIQQLPETICGPSAAGETLQFCNNAIWAFVGTDGQTGVRGRVAEQFALGGAPYTTPATSDQPVHRYTTQATLFASSPSDFNEVNTPECAGLDSSKPCGILAGLYSNTKIGGTYGGYGTAFPGTWAAASGPAMSTMMSTNENFDNSYSNVGDFLEKEHRFVDLPDNVIFLTNQVFSVKPYSNMTVTTNVITFLDTGMVPQYFYPIYNPADAAGYINVTNSLQVRTSAPECQFFGTNPNLPPGSENGNFYYGSAEFCPNNTGAWTAGPPGWTTDVNAAGKHPQFRMPSIDVAKLTCAEGLASTNPAGAYTMCGADFYAWLDAQVPAAQPRDDIHAPCKDGQYRHIAADGSTTKCRLDRTWVEGKRPDRPVQWWKFASDPVASSDAIEMDNLEDDYSTARQTALENETGERPPRGR